MLSLILLFPQGAVGSLAATVHPTWWTLVVALPGLAPPRCRAQLAVPYSRVSQHTSPPQPQPPQPNTNTPAPSPLQTPCARTSRDDPDPHPHTHPRSPPIPYSNPRPACGLSMQSPHSVPRSSPAPRAYPCITINGNYTQLNGNCAPHGRTARARGAGGAAGSGAAPRPPAARAAREGGGGALLLTGLFDRSIRARVLGAAV